jgi:hypothetical protein
LAEPVIKDTKRKNGSGHDTAERINYIPKTGQHLKDPVMAPFLLIHQTLIRAVPEPFSGWRDHTHEETEMGLRRARELVRLTTLYGVNRQTGISRRFFQRDDAR